MPQIKLNCLIIIQFTQGYHIAPWTENFQMFKLVLEKAEAPEIKLPISAGSSEKQEFQNNISFCFIDYTKAFDCVDHNKLWKILQESQRILYFSSVQSFSCVRLFATPWIAACQASLSITNSGSLPKLMPIEAVMPSSHLILCRLLLLLPPIPPSIRVFSKESTLCMRWPKYWSFSFSISPSNEHPGLIFFRMDLLDLLLVQATLKSLLQYHSSKASILLCSAFFIV